MCHLDGEERSIVYVARHTRTSEYKVMGIDGDHISAGCRVSEFGKTKLQLTGFLNADIDDKKKAPTGGAFF